MPGRSLIRKVAERVPREECEQRVLAALDDMRPLNTASVANHIWPNHHTDRFRGVPQGPGVQEQARPNRMPGS